jgi:hypothetical protein
MKPKRKIAKNDKTKKKSRVLGGVSQTPEEIDTPPRKMKTKRSVATKIFEAEKQIRESSKAVLRREEKDFLDQQFRSLEPENYEYFIQKIDDKLQAPEPQIIRDLMIFLLKEKDGWSWQRIGNYVFRNTTGVAARKSNARRAWERADTWLETDHPDEVLAKVLGSVGLF